MPATVTPEGYFLSPGIQLQIRPISKGPMTKVNGIIVHQTDSSTAKATLNAYLNAGNGAHFLIDKDGTTYQTAPVTMKTAHVGKLRGKCFETHICNPAQVRIGPQKHSAINRIEMQKKVPDRFPSNADSIGIELVGRCILDPKYIKPGMDATQIERLRGERGVYETVTPAQNVALHSLIKDLQSVLQIPVDQVFPHPRVSAKNPTEASTAKLPANQ